MTAKTHIQGKDCALEDSIETLGQRIRDLGFNIIEARWLNPAPNIFSVHIRDASCPQVFSNGKGLTQKAALASAYGEILERLSTGYLWADFRLDAVYKDKGYVHSKSERWFGFNELDGKLPEGFLDSNLIARYFNGTLNGSLDAKELIDVNAGALGLGVCSLAYTRQSDNQQVYIPVNLIANLFVSNGMSAGNNMDEAKVQGLSEIFERAIKQQIITQAISLPQVPESVIAKLPEIKQGLDSLNNQGFRVIALDASLGGQFPVMAVVLQHPKGGLYASFGAHTHFAVALERALTELLQGRALDELDGFPPPTANMEQVCDEHNLELHFIDSSGYVSWALLSNKPDYEFYNWLDNPIFSDKNAQAQSELIQLLKKLGFDTYIREYTQLGVAACRILVPGFSDVYLPDELVLNNNNQSLRVTKLLFNLPNLNPSQAESLLEYLQGQALNDQLRVAEWAGFLIDKQSPWGRLRIGELKCRLLLVLEEQEDALLELESLLNSQHLTKEEQVELSTLKAVLELSIYEEELSHYMDALSFYYTKERVQLALQQAQGQQVFKNYPALNSALPSTAHQTLIEAYAKTLIEG